MRIRRKIVLFLLLLVCFIVQGTFLKVKIGRAHV